MLLGVVHVLVFRGGDLPADPAVRAWRQAIVTLHTVLVGVASVLGLAVLAVEPRRGCCRVPRPRRPRPGRSGCASRWRTW